MIDWNRVDELRAEIGAEALAEVVSMFLAETDQEILALPEQAQPRGIEASLHFLKGSALNLGLAELARACAAGEAALASGIASPDLTPVLQVYAQSRSLLLAGLAGRSAA